MCEPIQCKEVRAVREMKKLLGGGGRVREGFLEEVAFEQELQSRIRGGEVGTRGSSSCDWSMESTGVTLDQWELVRKEADGLHEDRTVCLVFQPQDRPWHTVRAGQMSKE